jgi:hypothetical protein
MVPQQHLMVLAAGVMIKLRLLLLTPPLSPPACAQPQRTAARHPP